jgi:hypothetical protein
MKHLKTFEGIVSDHMTRNDDMDFYEPYIRPQYPSHPGINFVEGESGEWCAMYVDGKLKCSNYNDKNISKESVVRALGHTYKTITLKDGDLDKYFNGKCPKTYKELIDIKKRRISPEDPYGEEDWELK